jgi:hypothetical protein
MTVTQIREPFESQRGCPIRMLESVDALVSCRPSDPSAAMVNRFDGPSSDPLPRSRVL